MSEQDSAQEREHQNAYWQANLRIMGVLLVIWFVASFGLGILLVEPLNVFRLGGVSSRILVRSPRFDLCVRRAGPGLRPLDGSPRQTFWSGLRWAFKAGPTCWSA